MNSPNSSALSSSSSLSSLSSLSFGNASRRTSSSLLLAAALTALSGGATVGCGAATPEPRPDSELAVHTFTSDAAGFDTHSFWLDTGKEVVVFDAQFTPQLADQLIAEIQQQTSSPIRWLVVTHPNPDKFNGAPRFQAAGAKVVASRATADALAGVHAYKKYYFVEIAKQFSDETYPAQATIDVTFDDSFQLPLAGNVQLSLRRLSHPGISSTQTVAYAPSAAGGGALFVGDLVHHGAHAWLEGGIVDGAPRPDLKEWSAALDELRTFPASTVVYGGRGDAAPVTDAVAAQQAYLTQAGATVDRYLAGLGARRAELDDAAAAQQHYVAIEEELVRQMPERKLAYLVRYGVYGLVNARNHAR
jgi:glyoxylase-like metal-dependent hydrolase (beta-lactamase superfamily II)